MKFENVKNFRYSEKTGMWYNGNGGGYVIKRCSKCNELFLSREGKSKFCSKSCANSGETNPMYGKTHTSEVKERLRENFILINKKLKKEYNINNISELDSIKTKKGQIIINYKNVSKELKKEGYELLFLKGKNKYSLMTVKCPEGHLFQIKWMSWKRGHKCRECYYKRLRDEGIKNKEDFELYKNFVDRYTKKAYKIKYGKSMRGRQYHLDHKYSKYNGFKNGILPAIIGSLVNIELITCSENCRKQEKNSITKKELFNEYFRQIRTI